MKKMERGIISCCLLWAFGGAFAGCAHKVYTAPYIKQAATPSIQFYDAESRRDAPVRPEGSDVLTFFALGDWGTGDDAQASVAGYLKREVESLPERRITPFVLGLGDNVYEHGLNPGWGEPVDPSGETAEEQLHRTFGNMYGNIRFNLDHYDESERLVFHVVHGNHDYEQDVELWETKAEALYDGSNAELPVLESYTLRLPGLADSNSEEEYEGLKAAKGDPNNITTLPERVPTDGPVAIIALDSPDMIYRIREGNNQKETIQKHWDELARLVEEAAAAPWLMIIDHHPVATHGPHDRYWVRGRGFEKAKYVAEFLRGIPLLKHAFGLVPGLKKYPSPEDQHHPANRAFRSGLMEAAAKARSTVVFVSGHDHNLQLLTVAGQGADGTARGFYQVVSGSAGKKSPVRRGAEYEDLVYSYAEHGLVRFDATDDELWMEYIDVGPEPGRHLFRLSR